MTEQEKYYRLKREILEMEKGAEIERWNRKREEDANRVYAEYRKRRELALRHRIRRERNAKRWEKIKEFFKALFNMDEINPCEMHNVELDKSEQESLHKEMVKACYRKS